MYLILVVCCGFLAVLVTVGVLLVAVRPGSRVRKQSGWAMAVRREIVWAMVPFAVAAGVFLWGGTSYWREQVEGNRPVDVFLVVREGAWKWQHPGGRTEYDTLRLPVGRRVRLVMTSDDDTYLLVIPGLGIKTEVTAGQYQVALLETSSVGTFDFVGHRVGSYSEQDPTGFVVVETSQSYLSWVGVRGPSNGNAQAIGPTLEAKDGGMGGGLR